MGLNYIKGASHRVQGCTADVAAGDAKAACCIHSMLQRMTLYT